MTKRQRWYVVCSDSATKPRKRDRIWTLSRSKTTVGWTTDCGYPGYGLTWREAAALAGAANGEPYLDAPYLGAER